MKATPESQQRLLEVQAVDTIMDQLKYRRDSLAEHEMIAGVVAARRVLRERRVAADTECSDIQTECDKAEADLLPVRERLTRNQTRIDNGQVSDAKVLSSLIEEVAHLKRRISELEDEQLDAMERLEAAVDHAAGLGDQDKKLVARQRELTASRDAQVADFEQDLAARAAQRAELAAGVPADLLADYNTARTKFGGIGVAKLAGGRCSGCQLESTAADLNRYRTAPLDEVLRCEECDRILVR